MIHCYSVYKHFLALKIYFHSLMLFNRMFILIFLEKKDYFCKYKYCGRSKSNMMFDWSVVYYWLMLLLLLSNWCWIYISDSYWIVDWRELSPEYTFYHSFTSKTSIFSLLLIDVKKWVTTRSADVFNFRSRYKD